MSRFTPPGTHVDALGIDIGATKIAIGLVDSKGLVRGRIKIATKAKRRPARIVDDLSGLIHRRWKRELEARMPVGIAVPGVVDRRGTVVFGPNIGWNDLPLRAQLARRIDGRVSIINDVQAAAYGEWKFGALRGCDHAVAILVGTGVGGGIISNGRLNLGATGVAGHLGHLTISVGGRKCSCSNSGCLEAYVSGWAIAKRAQEAAADDPVAGQRLVGLARSRSRITAETVATALKQGDPLARKLVAETADYLAAGVVSVINGFNPQKIVLGGGVLDGVPSLVRMVRQRVRGQAIPAALKRLKMIQTSLGPDGVLIGAAEVARVGGLDDA